MRLFITGASGFLGRHIVTEALSRGHEVTALVRPAADTTRLDWATRDGVSLVRADLRSRSGLAECLRGTDCVIHAAAAKSGDLHAQMAGTVVATERLLDAMVEAGVRRIVTVSTFSVYDYSRLRCLSVLNEESRIERTAQERDDYAKTKLIQERLVLERGEKHGWNVAVLRPGVIYGRDNWWTARIGVGGTGRTWLLIGGLAKVPLTYVENCAEAIVLAAERDLGSRVVLNVVDDDPPRQLRYAIQLRRRLASAPTLLVVPYLLVRTVAQCARMTNRLIFKGRAKVPGILVPERLDARFKPLRYCNDRIRQVLGWKPRYSLNEALDRSFA